MNFIDKIYYKIYKGYKEKFKESDPEIYAIMYLVVMLFFHVILLLKFLNILGIETDTSQFSVFEKSMVIISVFALFSFRYYFFFDPLVFESKHKPSDNYRPIIIYTTVFFIFFWVLILNF